MNKSCSSRYQESSAAFFFFFLIDWYLLLFIYLNIFGSDFFLYNTTGDTL